MPITIPQIEIHTVGAGGGSIAWLDIDGALRVGPRSAGAVPGPACYDNGGTEPTITDANLVLGRLSMSLLDGDLPLNAERARDVVANLAKALHRPEDLDWLAEGIIRLAVTTMAGAIRTISIERGYDPRDFTLVAMGGAGPMHAVLIASELGIREVLVPPWPGNSCALGLLAGDLRHDFVRTVLWRLADLDVDKALHIYAEMESSGASILRGEGLRDEHIVHRRSIDMRYVGQAFQLTFEVPQPMSRETFEREFRETYRRRYGHDHQEAMEIVNLRSTCLGLTRKPELPTLNVASANLAPARRRPVHFAGRWHDSVVLRREDLGEGARVDGPAIVEEFGTTTVVPPQWTLTAAMRGMLFIRPTGEEAG